MTSWLEGLRSDVACAFHSLGRAPGFAATAVLVLGAAIALNATLFTVVAGIVWRPWGGVSAPNEIVRIYAQDPSAQVTGLSIADARALATQASTLQGVGMMRGDTVEIEVAGESRPASALMVSGNLLDLLGVAPALGRRIVADDDREGRPAPVVMLAYTTWERRFGADPAVIGSPLRINDVSFTIVGVMSSAFESAEPAYDIDLYLPAGAVTVLKPGNLEAARTLSDPRACCADVVGRLRPGATRTQLEAELGVLARRWTAVSGLPARAALVSDTTFLAQPGRTDSVQALVTVTMLAGGVVLVWLVACANIGNLSLARTLARARDIGTRAALGASRGRLVRFLLTEGLVLGLLAAAVGAAASAQLPHLLFVLVADSATRVQFPFPVTPDASVLTYVVVIGMASALVCSLAPALMVTRVALRRAVARDVEVFSRRIRLRSLFLGVQMAISVILLASAGLLARGAQRGAASIDPGFRVDGVTVVGFAVPERTYDRARATALFETISQTMRQRQDAAYAFASRDPFSLYREGTLIRLPGESTESLHEVLYLDVSPDYLSLLEIPLRAGRGFSEPDTGQPSVVVNEAMAQAFWPGCDPVGQSFVMRRRGPSGEMVVQQVIGVARNVSVSASAGARPTFYRAIAPGTEVVAFLSQDPRASQAPVLLVKGPRAAAAQAAAAATSRDPRIRATLTPLADSLARVQASMKWGPLLAATLGIFALALTTVGMFGVFAYAVQQRTREIGVRMALGAEPAAVVRLIVTGHSRAVAIGVAVGILGAIASSVGLRARLFGLSPIDPVTYGGVALLLACCSLAATYIPVRRATQISPTVALRSE